MEYINVLKDATPYTQSLDMMPSLLMQNKNSLISLKGGYDAKVSIKKIDAFHRSMCRFNKRYKIFDPVTWIDSGG